MTAAKFVQRLKYTEETVYENPDGFDQSRKGGGYIVLDDLTYYRAVRWSNKACSSLVAICSDFSMYVPKG